MDNFTFSNKLLRLIVLFTRYSPLFALLPLLAGCKFSLSWKGSEKTSDTFVIVERIRDSASFPSRSVTSASGADFWSQAGEPDQDNMPFIVTGKSYYSFNENKETADILIKSNVPYRIEVKSGKEWISIIDTSVKGRIVFSVEKLDEPCERKGLLEISAGDLTKVVTVQQIMFDGECISSSNPGTIAGYLQNEHPDSVKNLKISGTINADDLRFISQNLSNLEYLDLKDCKILEMGIPENLFCSQKRVVKLKQVIFPEKLEYIGRRAFEKCIFLEGPLELPASLKVIDDAAFMDCSQLKGPLILPASLEKIGNWAFARCTNINGELILPSKLQILGERAFTSCYSITGELIIPASVSRIRFAAFSSCRGLERLQLPSGLKAIEKHAFSYCTSLKGDLILPHSLESIGFFAFTECTSLTGHLKLPESIKSIGMKAFFRCDSLTSFSVTWSVPPVYAPGMLPSEAEIIVPERLKDYYGTLPGWNTHKLLAGNRLTNQ